MLPGCSGCHEAATKRRDAWAALSPFGRGTASWHSRAPSPLLPGSTSRHVSAVCEAQGAAAPEAVRMPLPQ